MCTSVVGIDSGFQLGWAQGVVGLRDRAFAMHPLGLNRVEPGAFHGQRAGDNPHASSVRFDMPIVGAHPRTDGLALVPRGVIPDKQQGGEALLCQAGTTPSQKVCRHGTDGTPFNTPDLPLLGVLRATAHQQSITRQGVGRGVGLRTRQFLESRDGSGRDPAMLVRLGQTAPPDLIGKAERPGRMGSG
jgi:hypothetical protein